jgi:hypothetical protein
MEEIRKSIAAFLLNPRYYEPDLTGVKGKEIIELDEIESFTTTPILDYIKKKRPGDRNDYGNKIYKIKSKSGKVGYFAVAFAIPAVLPALVRPAFNKSVRKRSVKRSTKRSAKKSVKRSVKRKSSKRSQ